MIEIKNLNPDIHIDYAEMLVKTLKLSKNTLNRLSQVIVTRKTIVLKDSQGLYLNTFSFSDVDEKLMSLCDLSD